ncbi:hypothetical protein ACFL21_04965 [Patescibacteria group bacterium]
MAEENQNPQSQQQQEQPQQAQNPPTDQAEATPSPQPETPPAEPATPPQEPAQTPEQSTEAPAEPATPPQEPQQTSEQSTEAPAEPATPPQEPAQTPEQSTEPPAEPATPPQSETAAPAEQGEEKPKVQSESIPAINDENWNDKQYELNRKFFKTFSPRIFYYPFSLQVDVLRAKQKAKQAGFTVPENALILDKGGMFWTDLMVEVVDGDPNAQNPDLVTINNTFQTSVSKEQWFKMKGEIANMKLKLAKEPQELYVLHTANVAGEKQQDIQKIILAV